MVSVCCIVIVIVIAWAVTFLPAGGVSIGVVIAFIVVIHIIIIIVMIRVDVLAVVLIVGVAVGPAAHAFSVHVVHVNLGFHVACKFFFISLAVFIVKVLNTSIVRAILPRRCKLPLGAHLDGESVILVVVLDVNLICPWILGSDVVFSWIHAVEHVSRLDHHGT